jgi:putative transposase
MARPLDGIGLLAYCRRHGFGRATQALLAHIRSSPPSRIPGARRGNMPVWYPSKKMRCIIKAESHKVEFAFLLQAEHDDDILEVWDQPPAIQLEYPDQHNRIQRPMHTADYFLFGREQCGWIECKPTQELVKQAEKRPNRYILVDDIWRCPPGETYAAKYGLTYRVWTSDQINWAAQENWLYLKDYSSDLERLVIPEAAKATLHRLVDEHPGILLSTLRAAAIDIPADLINIAIARHDLYVDLATYRLSEPWRTPVFRSRQLARACVKSESRAKDELMGHATTPEQASSITLEGRILLEQARDVDLATAVFRNRVINPDQYDDDEQTQVTPQAQTIPARTKRRWWRFYRDAELRYGSGFIGLLPQFARAGRKRGAGSESVQLIHQVLETHYDTVTHKPKRGAYGEYLKRVAEQHLTPLSPRTFYREVERHKAAYEQTVARQGTRAAYPFKDYVHAQEKTISRHGSYAWAMGHLDHTELNLILCDSRTGQPLGKCWLTLLILSHPRRIAAFYLTFDPPSYRSCLMVLRLCVKRYGRLPSAITVDGGPEFQSVYFEQLLALYRVRKHQRPASEPRFGSPQERLFGSMETEFLYHLLGNTQATREPRQNTRATDPARQAVWTLPDLAEQVQQWADEEYDTLRHPALGMAPREAYELSIERDGERAHKLIPYDEMFRMTTLPTTRKGTALVRPGVGVRINYLEYWCEAMRDPTVEHTQVKVRYDPFDVSVAYAYVDGVWRQCFTPYDEFAGCSERELQLLASELRQSHRLHSSREQVQLSQKQLADFRRENATKQEILRQQRHDRETRAALVILESGRSSKAPVPPPSPIARSAEGRQGEPPPSDPPQEVPEQKYDKLLVFKRIRL